MESKTSNGNNGNNQQNRVLADIDNTNTFFSDGEVDLAFDELPTVMQGILYQEADTEKPSVLIKEIYKNDKPRIEAIIKDLLKQRNHLITKGKSCPFEIYSFDSSEKMTQESANQLGIPYVERKSQADPSHLE